jgi:hypothetical protein
LICNANFVECVGTNEGEKEVRLDKHYSQ